VSPLRRFRGSRWILAAVLLTALFTGCAKTGVTNQANEVHQLFVTITVIALPIFIVVEVLIVFFALRYRKRDDEAPPQQYGSTKALGIFFLIPLVIVAILYAFGETTLTSISKQDPNPQVVIKVVGFQWEWTFYYLNEGFYTTGKTLVKPAEMVVPVGVPVHIELESRDVIHSFFVPDFLFKRDLIPGHPNDFTFTANTLGTFQGQCAEFCGLHHAQMTFTLRVVTMGDYLAWVEATKTAALNVSCPISSTGSLSITAQNISWNTDCLAVAANTPFSISVINNDAGIDHNFSIYTNSTAQKRVIPDEGKFPGVATQTYQIDALPPGRYYFQCDVHGPAMSGTFIVGAGV
jgi:cytochrome c oxidase subunit II